MYNKRNGLKRKKKDFSKRNDLNPILSDAIKLAFMLALAAAALSVKYYLERQSIIDEIREGNLTETDLVQRFVKDFYLQLPSKYIYVAKQNLKQLQSCRTFRELRRTFNRIGFSNTEGLKQISLLESAYNKYLSEKPKKIGVNGKVAYDRKPKGIITHDSMPWCKHRLKRKKKDLSFGISAPVNTPLGIGLLAAPVVIPLIARVISSVYNKIRAHMNNRELMRQIQDGRLTERDLVQSFVNQFFSELPSKYVDLYRKQLRRLQTCNTFRELKRTYKEIGFANTVGMNTITKLESDYLRAVANRPKSISVNGAITHDSMPWAHINLIHRDANNEKSKKIQQNLNLAEQSIKVLERSDDSQLHVYLDKIKKKLEQIWKFINSIGPIKSVGVVAAAIITPILAIKSIKMLSAAIKNRITQQQKQSSSPASSTPDSISASNLSKASTEMDKDLMSLIEALAVVHENTDKYLKE